MLLLLQSFFCIIEIIFTNSELLIDTLALKVGGTFDTYGRKTSYS